MDKKKRLILAAFLILLAIVIYLFGKGLLKYLFSSLSCIIGIIEFFFPEITPKKSEDEESEQILRELVEERSKREELKSKVESKDDELSEIKKEKSQKEERIEYILESLERKGIRTDYLIEKYDKPLNSILMIFHHQKPKRFIRKKIEEMGGEVFGGKVGIVPPQKVPKGNLSTKKLGEWYRETFLGDDREKEYKVRLMRIDLKKAFTDENIIPDNWENPNYGVLEGVFNIYDLLSTEEFYNLLSREISFKDEMKENIGLLLIPVANKEQLDTLLGGKTQLKLQGELGDIDQILNTSTEKIADILLEYVDNGDSLAEEVKAEAEKVKEKYNF